MKKENKMERGKPTPKKKETRREREEREARSAKRVKVFITVFAIVALSAILGLILTFVGINIYNGLTIDYENDDLSRYVEISPDDYKGWEISLDIDEITDKHIDDHIMGLLYMRRKLSENSLYYETESKLNGKVRPVSIGDELLICYNSYRIDENGNRVTVNDVYSKNGELCEIGEGAYPIGFELGLLGAKIEEHTVKCFDASTARPIQLGDRVEISYKGIYADGSYDSDTVKAIVTVDPTVCDAMYGEGFADFLIGKGIGTFEEMYRDDKDQHFYYNTEDGRNVFVDIKVSAIYEVSEPLRVEAKYPIGYAEEALAGERVYYEVFFYKTLFYDTPEFDEKFITEELGIKPEELAKWGEDGDTAVERYRAYIKASLEEAELEGVREELELAMWKHYTSVAKVKWLPKGSVNLYYDDYVDGFKSDFLNSGDTYTDLGDYISATLNLSANENWQDVVRARAEQAVLEQVIFYYIVREEGFMPTDYEYAELKEQFISDYIDEQLISMGCVESAFKTEEEYLERKAQITSAVKAIITEEFIRENILYNYAMDKVVGLADVTYVKH